jgi:hypothetical protein
MTHTEMMDTNFVCLQEILVTLVAVMLFRIGYSVSMVVTLLGTVKDGSSYDRLLDCDDGWLSFRCPKGLVIL